MALKRSTKIVLAIVVVVVVVPVAAIVGMVGYVQWATRPVPIIDVDDTDWSARRAAWQAGARRTKIGPPPQDQSNDPAPEGVEVVRYPSTSGQQMAAWLKRPTLPTPAPALVFLHGGFAFGAGDFDVPKVFVDEGWAVMAPMLRGENGNPGTFELFWGEVDDAANAVRWLAKQPGIDAKRIYVIGHSVGGGVAAMLSLVPDVPVALTASAGGLYPEEVFIGWQDITPFSFLDREGRRLRVLHPHIPRMVHEHIAWVGVDDGAAIGFARDVAKEIEGKGFMLQVREAPGDHHSSVPAILQAFRDEIAAREKAGR